MNRLHKFWSLPRREKRAFCEAVILVVLSNFFMRAIAFRYIERFLRSRWAERVPPDHGDVNEIRIVEISVARAARLLPWESLCLSRSIAAFIMLRRRGIPAVLYAGVKILENSSLSAHAWVRTGRAVEGNSEGSAFTVVMRIG